MVQWSPSQLHRAESHKNMTTSVLWPFWVTLTWSPMTHCPALIFSTSKCRVCLSAYFTPISILLSIPLVFAWKTEYAAQRTVHSDSVLQGQKSLTMLANARRVVCTWVMFPFSNRSLASKMSLGLRPYVRIALMKFPRFSSCGQQVKWQHEGTEMLQDTSTRFVNQSTWSWTSFFGCSTKPLPCASSAVNGWFSSLNQAAAYWWVYEKQIMKNNVNFTLTHILCHCTTPTLTSDIPSPKSTTHQPNVWWS